MKNVCLWLKLVLVEQKYVSIWVLVSDIDLSICIVVLLVVSCKQGPLTYHLVSIWKRTAKTLDFYVSQVEQAQKHTGRTPLESY